MRILITNCRLSQRTGTELFAGELARVLRAAHEVAIYSPILGELATALRGEGIEVVANPGELGWTPDVVHAQHHMTAMAVLARCPGVPLVYHCHGAVPWEEWPPVHPRVVRYLAPGDAFLRWFEAEYGIRRNQVEVLPLCMELGGFQCADRIPRERRLLIVSNYLKEDSKEVRLFQEAGEACNVGVDLVGWRFGRVVERMAEVLPRYHWVVAAGRTAMEALAAGCVVFPCSAARIGRPLSSDDLAVMRENLFVPREEDALLQNVSELVRWLKVTEGWDTTETRRWILEQGELAHFLPQLNRVYAEAAAGLGAVSAIEENESVAAYLERIAGHVLMADAHFRRLREGWEATKEKLRLLEEKRK